MHLSIPLIYVHKEVSWNSRIGDYREEEDTAAAVIGIFGELKKHGRNRRRNKLLRGHQKYGLPKIEDYKLRTMSPTRTVII